MPREIPLVPNQWESFKLVSTHDHWESKFIENIISLKIFEDSFRLSYLVLIGVLLEWTKQRKKCTDLSRYITCAYNLSAYIPSILIVGHFFVSSWIHTRPERRIEAVSREITGKIGLVTDVDTLGVFLWTLKLIRKEMRSCMTHLVHFTFFSTL